MSLALLPAFSLGLCLGHCALLWLLMYIHIYPLKPTICPSYQHKNQLWIDNVVYSEFTKLLWEGLLTMVHMQQAVDTDNWYEGCGHKLLICPLACNFWWEQVHWEVSFFLVLRFMVQVGRSHMTNIKQETFFLNTNIHALTAFQIALVSTITAPTLCLCGISLVLLCATG